MKLTRLGNTPQHMLPASDMHSACNRKQTLSQHQGAALANLFEDARNGLRHASAGNVDNRH